MRLFPELLMDAYKFDHRRQYPKNTQFVQANLTARGTRIHGVTHIYPVGFQWFLQDYLMEQFNERFFNHPVDAACARYQRRLNQMLGPNTVGTDHIRALHQRGYLPLEFKAIPEGTAFPLKVPFLLVENTDPDFFWLVNYIETLMSSALWLPTTSATAASLYRRIFEKGIRESGGDPSFVDWQGHDFSFRGMENPEAAAASAFGHGLFFTGTDTVPMLDMVEQYYPVLKDGKLDENYLIGGSVTATEHSVMCAGQKDGEKETILRLLTQYPTGILSVVSDTWDLWNVVTRILVDAEVKTAIMQREGKYVTRPDSGDPVLIITGDEEATPGSPAHKGVVECLWDGFKGQRNQKGFKELDSHVGSIYGDSITQDRAEQINARLIRKGFATNNWVAGIGSFTYQYVTRDTHCMAMKATWTQQNGVGIDLFKDPVTDSGMKKSAVGRLAALPNGNGSYYRVDRATPEEEAASVLRPIWRNGHFLVYESYEQLRQRARQSLIERPNP